MEDKLEVLS